jgi:zinc protease
MLTDSIHHRVLDNGLKVICVQKRSAPVVAAQVWYRTGSANEHDGIRGLSHLLEHMMFRGSAHVGPEEHARRVNEVGGHSNAFTAEDVTSYVNSVPRDNLEQVLELEADRMQNLTLDPELFETERKVIVEEYHTYMNNPVAKAFLEFRSAFYGEHPYSISPLGRLQDIRNVSQDECRAYYEQWYRPDNAVVVVAGDFDSADTVTQLVEKHFGGIKPASQASMSRPEEPKKKETQRKASAGMMRRRVDFDVPVLISGYPAPASANADALLLEILQVIVSQGETSRLYAHLVRRDALAVMAGGMNHMLRLPGMSLFFAIFTPDVSARRVEAALNDEVDMIRENGISQKEFEKVQNTALAQRCFEMFSAENICQRVGFAETVEGDYRKWVERLTALEHLDRDTLIDAAKRYWDPKNRRTLYLKPKRVNPALLVAGLARRVLPRK